MRLGTLIVGASFLIGFVSNAQEGEEDKECLRMRFLAAEALKVSNYTEASMYYLKGETICGNYDKANFDRMIGSLRNAAAGESDAALKTAYIDTLIGVYERAETAGFYDTKDDLIRANYLIQASKPDRKKADKFFASGISTQGKATGESYLANYYYNLYMLFYGAKEVEKADLKKQLIARYFDLTKLITDAGMSIKTQEILTTYFNLVVQSCADILPELEGYIQNLPEEVEARKAAIKNFLSLLETKNCTDSKYYEILVVELDKIDPSIDSKIAIAKYKIAKKQFSDAITAFREAKKYTSDADKIDEIDYNIAYAMYSQGSYTAAYNAAMSVGGKFKGNALVIAGNSVAKNANNCGTSTFERKCNYIYADQLLDRAVSAGASGVSRSAYRGSYPTDGEIFDAGSPSSVSLSCYGVSVSVK